MWLRHRAIDTSDERASANYPSSNDRYDDRVNGVSPVDGSAGADDSCYRLVALHSDADRRDERIAHRHTLYRQSIGLRISGQHPIRRSESRYRRDEIAHRNVERSRSLNGRRRFRCIGRAVATTTCRPHSGRHDCRNVGGNQREWDNFRSLSR